MEKFVFTDGDKIGVSDGEKTALYESEYILRYREYAETRVKNDEWKYTGEGARFRGDYDTYRAKKETVRAYVNSAQIEGNKVVYAFTVNGASGVYRKDVSDEKAREEHILSSSDSEILTLHRGAENTYAVTVRANGVTSHIGILYGSNSELKTLTDGDTRDQNAYFSAVNRNEILFDSAGVGRDSEGNFSGRYSPAVICSLDLGTMEIKEIFRDKELSCTKPKQAKDGALYCIQRPNREKRGGNPLVEILLIPYRIIQAIVMFVQAFVTMFTGKSMTSGGSNPARGRETDSRKLFVDGNLIEAEKELKRNKRFKDKEYGFIPMSWKLVKIENGKAVPIKSGICDFDLCEDGGIYCTNGKHVFYIKDGNTVKVADADMCLSVSTASERSFAEDDLFL